MKSLILDTLETKCFARSGFIQIY